MRIIYKANMLTLPKIESFQRDVSCLLLFGTQYHVEKTASLQMARRKIRIYHNFSDSNMNGVCRTRRSLMRSIVNKERRTHPTNIRLSIQ